MIDMWILEAYLEYKLEDGRDAIHFIFHVADGYLQSIQDQEAGNAWEDCELSFREPRQEVLQISSILIENGWTVNYWKMDDPFVNPKHKREINNRIKGLL